MCVCVYIYIYIYIYHPRLLCCRFRRLRAIVHNLVTAAGLLGRVPVLPRVYPCVWGFVRVSVCDVVRVVCVCV